MSSPVGTIAYVELPAPELERTKAFYASVFGWEWTDFGSHYSATKTPTLEVGLNAFAEPAPRGRKSDGSGVGPTVLLRTERLEEVLEAVTDAGGEVTMYPHDYPSGCRFHFADPSGNVLGVFAVPVD